MPLLRGYRQTVFIQADRTRTGIGNFKHQLRDADYLAPQHPLLCRQCHAGIDRILQGIGKDNGQLSLVRRRAPSGPAANP